jgi:anaerobic ribonucleoside-triphosphate reductase
MTFKNNKPLDSLTVGPSVKEIEHLVMHGNNDNANIQYNPESIHKFISDVAMKQYALIKMYPARVSESHLNGYIHIHDLEYAYDRSLNCLQHDPRFFIRNGLKVDGTGISTSAAGSAKNAETLINHLGQVMSASQGCMSGGQAISFFNTFISPFVEGLSYDRVKQLMQMMIFNLNMSYTSRGSQPVFSTIGLDFTVPDWLKDKDAYGPGGIIKGTYSDYEEEMQTVLKAFTEVLYEGDSNQTPHLFPNTIYNIRKDSFKHDDLLLQVHELSAKFSTPYFTQELNGPKTVMGCYSYDMPFIYKYKDEIHLTTIGEFVETNLNSPKTCGESIYQDINGFTVPSWNRERNIFEWKPILNIIKNPPTTLYEVKFSKNKSVKCTSDHPFYKIGGDYINKEPVKLQDLKVGDMVITLNKIGEGGEHEDPLGRLIGFFLGDGSINKHTQKATFSLVKQDKIKYLTETLNELNIEYTYHEHYIERYKHTQCNFYILTEEINEILFDIYMENKKVPSRFLKDENVILGIVGGLINSDGYMRITNGFRKNISIEFTSTNENIAQLYFVGLLLNGIHAGYGYQKNPSKNMQNKNGAFRINYSGKALGHLLQKIKLKDSFKTIYETHSISLKEEPTWSRLKIKSITQIDNNKPVYDIEVKDNHNFLGGNGYILSGNCRTALNTNWTNDPEEDIIKTGNLAYVSLNLPRYALKGDFWDELDLAMEIAVEALLVRKQHAHKMLDNGLMKFLTQKDIDGTPYYRVENATLSFGVVGLSDALRVLHGSDITNNKIRKEGHKIMQYINDYASSLQNETGYRWTVLQTPAESTAGKFATEDKRRYPTRAPVHGERGGYYYTNSTHVDVDAPINLVQRIQTEHNFHKETMGGHIMHLWFGEFESNPSALMSLTEKIYKNSNAGFWTYTSAYSICNSENKLLKGIHDKCSCGSDVDVFDRITGYMQRVSGWNKHKQAEFKDRKRY